MSTFCKLNFIPISYIIHKLHKFIVYIKRYFFLAMYYFKKYYIIYLPFKEILSLYVGTLVKPTYNNLFFLYEAEY